MSAAPTIAPAAPMRRTGPPRASSDASGRRRSTRRPTCNTCGSTRAPAPSATCARSAPRAACTSPAPTAASSGAGRAACRARACTTPSPARRSPYPRGSTSRSSRALSPACNSLQTSLQHHAPALQPACIRPVSPHLSPHLSPPLSPRAIPQEEARLLDGSFASALDATLLRQEQYDALSEAPRPHAPSPQDDRDHHPPHPAAGPASQRCGPLAPPSLAALVPTLLRALRVCKWAQVYTFYTGAPGAAAGAAAGSAAAGGAAAGGGAAAARLRLALGQLEECTDWLLAACDADGRRGAVDWAALRSDEGLAKSEWLVVTILYIYSHA